MKIIIVGGGKTGSSLARALTLEGHNVTIVDMIAERVSRICDDCDAMGLIGDGLEFSALTEAGLADADVLIAVTGSDEKNLLCCLFAKKVGDCSTIARVRNPMYLREINFIREQIGLSMVINAEHAAAVEIARLLRVPSAIEVNTFCKGKLELLTFKIEEDSVLVGKTVSHVRSRLDNGMLFCMIDRGGKFHIPSGGFELQAGDKASIVISPKETMKFFRRIGLDTHNIKHVMIAGGGTMSFYLANLLLDIGIEVKIIEQDADRCDVLAEKLPGVAIIHGDAMDKTLLMEEGITNTDAFISLTGFDEENIMLSLFAKDVSDAKVITKLDRIEFDNVITKLNLDSVIYPRNITQGYLLQYVRTKQNAMGNNVENLYRLVDDQVEALEFKIREGAPVIGVPICEMNLKPNVLICGIARKGKIILPGGSDYIEAGDRVIVVTSQKQLDDIQDILR